MIQKTYKELLNLEMMVGSMYAKNPSLRDTKFGYGYKRFYDKNLKNIFSLYNEELMNIRIDHALTNPVNKALLTAPTTNRGFEYDKEGLKGVVKAERELDMDWELKSFEIEPYFIKPEYLSDFNEEQIELMKGIIAE